MDWLSKVEKILKLNNVSEDRQVKLVATRLKGRAMDWWKQTKSTRKRIGKSKVVMWDKMKRMMKANFLPYNYLARMNQQLQKLSQGSRGKGVVTSPSNQNKGVNCSINVSKRVNEPVVHGITKTNVDGRIERYHYQESDHRSIECPHC